MLVNIGGNSLAFVKFSWKPSNFERSVTAKKSFSFESRGRSRQESTESGRCVGKVSLEFVTARKVQVIQNEKGPKYKKLKIFSKRGQFRNIANPAENSTPRPRTQTCGATKRFSREGGREARTSEKGTKHVYGWIRLRFRE